MGLFNLSRAVEKDRREYLNSINRPPIPPIVIDGHMHIMTSHCTPLPLLWSQIPGGWTWKPSTETLDSSSRSYLGRRKFAFGEMGRIGQKGTVLNSINNPKADPIADEVEKANHSTYYDTSLYGTKFFSPMIGMPMDMDFAHYAGFEGHKIYYKAKEWDYIDCQVSSEGYSSNIRIPLPPRPQQVTSDNPLSEQLADQLRAIRKDSEPTGDVYGPGGGLIVTRGTSKRSRYFFVELSRDDKTGTFKETIKWLDEGELVVFRPFESQILDVKYAALKHPWRHIPFYHYDPRRWARKPRKFMAEIATERSPGMFLGVKMYPSLGFKPQDWDRIDGLWDFYDECSRDQIPILSHCSPGGMYTHERPLFFHKDKPASQTYEKMHKKDYEAAQNNKRFKQSWEEFYFSQSYVSPANWAEVLDKFKNLRLCLAHFGGDEPGFSCWGEKNADHQASYSRTLELWDEIMVRLVRQYANCYIDISYLDISYSSRPEKRCNFEKFKSLMEADGDHTLKNKIIFGTDWYLSERKWRYKEYCAETLAALNRIDETLWPRFCCLNPLKYLRLGKVADNLAAGMKRELQKMLECELNTLGIGRTESNRKIDEQLQLFRNLDTQKYARFIGYPE
jgi:predicted TIM-barrel fold metal-dependent hydrolase